MPTKPIPAVVRVTQYFATADLAAVEVVLEMVQEVVRQRRIAAAPKPKAVTPDAPPKKKPGPPPGYKPAPKPPAVPLVSTVG